MTIPKILQGKPKRHIDRVPSDDYDEWDSRYMLRTDQDDFGERYNDMWGQKGWFKPSCVPITIILLLIVLVVILPLLDAAEKHHRSTVQDLFRNRCLQNCSLSIVETIPDGMSYRNGSTPFKSTYDVWKEMIDGANESIEIASFYWTLRDSDVNKFPGSEKGEDIFKSLMEAGTTRGLKIRIVQSEPTKSMPDLDTEIFTRKGVAEVRNLNMARLLGSGILHTKLWLVDRKVVYVGSANMDWRSLSHVKELGLYMTNCSCLVEDMAKIFEVYWLLATPDSTIPDTWPEDLSTEINKLDPVQIYINGTKSSTYISSSPAPLCPEGRTSDIDSILSTIEAADKFIYIAVMDYMPLMMFTPKPKYWPVIDNALKAAAIDRRVEVRLLVSWTNHSRKEEKLFLNSLQVISDSYKGVKITVKLFVVPSTAAQAKIPYARLNHNKYMVTDNTAYIGTSNWSGDYFNSTGGIGFVVIGENSLRDELESVFLRDWYSEFSYPLPKWLH
ncbi:unnamed protein product [Nezara viridula]|uniref:PLD phosphodiesterase domain-containing protein n=1 Tax=Nezara viridula TaxID=85310 RepID=A0A9P0E6N5_NEZVI|nr:unnamed protein product [Nezara viridula]